MGNRVFVRTALTLASLAMTMGAFFALSTGSASAGFSRWGLVSADTAGSVVASSGSGVFNAGQPTYIGDEKLANGAPAVRQPRTARGITGGYLDFWVKNDAPTGAATVNVRVKGVSGCGEKAKITVLINGASYFAGKATLNDTEYIRYTRTESGGPIVPGAGKVNNIRVALANPGCGRKLLIDYAGFRW